MIEDRPITDFRSAYRWLSNFHLAEVHFEGHAYPSSEHAYQAAKADDGTSRLFPVPTLLGTEKRTKTRAWFRDPQPTGEKDSEGNTIFRVLTCGQAKRLGSQIPLRHDWEQVKLDVMETILRDKFTRHSGLRVQLLDTGDRELVEQNTWGDRFWGVCGVGENHLGRLLVKIRTGLRDASRSPLSPPHAVMMTIETAT